MLLFPITTNGSNPCVTHRILDMDFPDAAVYTNDPDDLHLMKSVMMNMMEASLII